MSIQFLSGGTTIWIGIGSGVIVAQLPTGEDLPYIPLNSVICFDNEGGLPLGAVDYTSNYYAFEYPSKWPVLTGTPGEDEWLLDDPVNAACFSTDVKMASVMGGARVSLDTGVNGTWDAGAMVISTVPEYVDQPFVRFSDESYGPVASHLSAYYWPYGVASWTGSDTFGAATLAFEVFDPTSELDDGTNLIQFWHVYTGNPGVWALETMDSVSPSARLLDALQEGMGFTEGSWWFDTWQDTGLTAVDNMSTYPTDAVAFNAGTGWDSGWIVTPGDAGNYTDTSLLTGTGAVLSSDDVTGVGQRDLWLGPEMHVASDEPAVYGFSSSAQLVRGTVFDGQFDLQTYVGISYINNNLVLDPTGAGTLGTTDAKQPADYTPFAGYASFTYWPWPTDTVGLKMWDNIESTELAYEVFDTTTWMNGGENLIQAWNVYMDHPGIWAWDGFESRELAARTLEQLNGGQGFNAYVPWFDTWLNIGTVCVDNMENYSASHTAFVAGYGWASGWTVTPGDIGSYTDSTLLTGTGAVMSTDDYAALSLSDLLQVPNLMGAETTEPARDGFVFLAEVSNPTLVDGAFDMGTYSLVGVTGNITEINTTGAGNLQLTDAEYPADYVPFASTAKLSFWPASVAAGYVAKETFATYTVESDVGLTELVDGDNFMLLHWIVLSALAGGVVSLDNFESWTAAAVSYDLGTYRGFGWDDTDDANPHPPQSHWNKFSLTIGIVQYDNFEMYDVSATVKGLGYGDETWEHAWHIYDSSDTWVGETALTDGGVDTGADWDVPTIVPRGPRFMDRALYLGGAIEFSTTEIEVTAGLIQGSAEDMSDTEIQTPITSGSVGLTSSQIPLDETAVNRYFDPTIYLHGWTA